MREDKKKVTEAALQNTPNTAVEESRSLATTSGTAVVPKTEHSRTIAGYDVGDVGTGFEDMTSVDFQVPFLAVLQKNSPQVEEENPKHLPGAKAGTLMNTVSNALYDGKQGIVFVPVHRTRTFIEWIPRDQGGGLVAVYDPQSPEVLAVLDAAKGQKFGKLSINDNNDLMETFNLFGIQILPDGQTENVVIGFASTQIGTYKKWMTIANSIKVDTGSGRLATPPMFSHRYRVTTAFFQKKDQTWHKLQATFDGPNAAAARLAPDSPLFEEAKKFRALLLSGAAKADYQSAAREDGGESEFDM